VGLASLLTCLHDSICLRSFVTFCSIGGFFWWGVVSYGPSPHAGGLVCIGCPRLLIHCIASCHPYLNVVSSISLTYYVPYYGDENHLTWIISVNLKYQNFCDHWNFIICYEKERYTSIDFIFSWEFIITTHNFKFQHIVSLVLIPYRKLMQRPSWYYLFTVMGSVKLQWLTLIIIWSTFIWFRSQ
jgi:hypothetical protein